MYLTTNQLLSHLTKDISANDLADLFSIITKLLSMYGRKIFQPAFITQLQNIEPALASCLQLLWQTGRSSHTDVQSLLTTLRRQGLPTAAYEVDTDKATISTIETMLRTKDTNKPAVVSQTKKNKTPGLRISGEGRYYERNLDRDVQKLL